METSEIIASFSVAVAVCTLFYTVIVNNKSRKLAVEANSQTKKVGLADLHAAWQGIYLIDPEKPITPHVNSALSALQLTAEYWLHEIVDKKIIYEYAWSNYKPLFDSLKICVAKLPETSVTGKECLTAEMGDAYAQMNVYKKD